MKKLIFDFDGTLVDSMQCWSGKMLQILDEAGADYPDDVIKSITPLGDKGAAQYFIDTFNIPFTMEEMLQKMHEYGIPAYRDTILAKDTVVDTLLELKKRGYSLNVLTASPHTMLDVCLKRIGIYDIFDNVWSCDDFNTTKSDVRIYSAAAERLGADASDCIFFDDNIHSLSTAKKAGMPIFGVYDDTSADMRSEIEELSEEYIYVFEEILKFLK